MDSDLFFEDCTLKVATLSKYSYKRVVAWEMSA